MRGLLVKAFRMMELQVKAFRTTRSLVMAFRMKVSAKVEEVLSERALRRSPGIQAWLSVGEVDLVAHRLQVDPGQVFERWISD